MRPFLREHIAGRPMLVGAGFALAAGLSLGSYLKAGDMFPERPAPQVYIPSGYAYGGDAVSYMMDADGRIPDYVIGADRLYPPPPMPTIRTAWEDEDEPPAAEEPAPEPQEGPEPAAYPIAVLETRTDPLPPSIGGDILAIDAPAGPDPVG